MSELVRSSRHPASGSTRHASERALIVVPPRSRHRGATAEARLPFQSPWLDFTWNIRQEATRAQPFVGWNMRRLHEMVAASIAEANEQERTQKMRSSHETWEQIVDRLFQKIEIVYLLEFALDGTMTFFRGSSVSDETHYGHQRLTISFGKRNVVLNPVMAPERDVFGFITVRNYPDNGRESFIICSLSEGWMVPKKETNMRRALSHFLPVKYVPITVDDFHEMLADLVQDHQPIFTFDGEVVYEKLSSILDQLISEERQSNALRLLSSNVVKDSFTYLKDRSNDIIDKGRGRLSIPNFSSTKLLSADPDKDQG